MRLDDDITRAGESRLPDDNGTIPILRYSTDGLPQAERYDAWLRRDWPRSAVIYRTEPSEPFSTRWESAQLGPVTFVYTEITGMRWERRVEDIRNSDFDPIIVSMMIEGHAQGDLGGRALREGPGSFHFHDLARPSLHVSTSSRTYALILPRPVAEEWLGGVEGLHGLLVDGERAAMLFAHAEQVHRALGRLDIAAGERLGRTFLELVALAAAEARPQAALRVTAEAALRHRAEQEIERRLASTTLTVTSLTRVLGIPRAKLFAAFRGDGGVHNYVMAQRLERVRAALADLGRSEPIGDIAHRFGFSDSSHLSRSFRARYGMSPREYRHLVATTGPDPN